MNTWLLTWNPKRWAWDDSINGYNELIEDVGQIGYAYLKWTCGKNKSIREGDRIFLIRLGKEPRGIIASGYAASDVFEGTHWDVERRTIGRKARRIYVKFDTIKDFSSDDILAYEMLKEIDQNFNWSSQASGINIPNEIAQKIENVWGALSLK